MDFWSIMYTLLQGFGTTLLLFVLTLLFALPLGLVICFGSMSKYKAVRIPIRVFLWIIRGTPLMLQLFIVWFLPGLVFKTPWGVFSDPSSNRFFAAVIAFVINYAAYFSEIYRGGFESISKGQYEAARVLGLTKWQTFRHIVLMQVVKRIVPPMSNETITLVKDTALANVISVVEIIWTAQSFAANEANILPLFYSGIFYLIFNGLLTVGFGFLEKKLNYYR